MKIKIKGHSPEYTKQFTVSRRVGDAPGNRQLVLTRMRDADCMVVVKTQDDVGWCKLLCWADVEKMVIWLARNWPELFEVEA